MSEIIDNVSPDLGFRLYKPGSSFVAKITNDLNASNKIKLSYTWDEAPLSAY